MHVFMQHTESLKTRLKADFYCRLDRSTGQISGTVEETRQPEVVTPIVVLDNCTVLKKSM